MSNLKNCPFCDSKAEHYSFNYRKHTVRCSYCLADCGEHDTPERAAFVWNTRPAEGSPTAEVKKLKVHCNALYDVLFTLQKFFEHFADNAELSEKAQEAHSEMVIAIVKALATVRKNGVNGTICPACKHKECQNCDLDTILKIQESADAPDIDDGTKGGE